MNLKDAALPAAVLRVLEERVKAARQQANVNVIESGDPEDRVTAVHNGRKLGSVSISKGRQSARVSDPERFARWIAEHYPAEVEHKPVVREAFLKAVLDASKKAGEGATPDGTLDVPGVEIYEGEPYVTVRLTHEAAEIVAEMVCTGAVSLDGGMPAVTGGVA